jgi:hypothetical protein
MTNWIEDTNRYQLAKPPQWWLQKLHDFDSSLVVVPSRQDCVYRLTQRRPLNLPNHIVNEALFNESDTKMLASYSLVPVTSIKARPNWDNPYMFTELANRAPWRLGGAEKVINDIEGREAREEMMRDIKTDEALTETAKSAWRYYKTRLIK